VPEGIRLSGQLGIEPAYRLSSRRPRTLRQPHGDRVLKTVAPRVVVPQLCTLVRTDIVLVRQPKPDQPSSILHTCCPARLEVDLGSRREAVARHERGTLRLDDERGSIADLAVVGVGPGRRRRFPSFWNRLIDQHVWAVRRPAGRSLPRTGDPASAPSPSSHRERVWPRPRNTWAHHDHTPRASAQMAAELAAARTHHAADRSLMM
jgi:hypothetical protein